MDTPPSPSRPLRRGNEQIVIRLPDGMRDQLKQRALANRRSANAEIVSRLEASLQHDRQLDAPK